MGDRFDLRDATISGSAFGTGATVHNDSAAAASVPDLIAALTRSREAIAESAPEPDRAEVLEALGRIEAELRSDTPRGAVVSSRWKTVTTLLGTLTEPAVKVADLVARLFG
ncbi:hypothetical protein GCM10027258_87540 [Amycolatopsis stemonae]